MDKTKVFALDIGTRKIAGLLMSPTTDGFLIEHASLYQQLPGAMADGQIHHIEAVSKIIKQIKAELEQKSGQSLAKVAVAAAGRSLLIQTGYCTKRLQPHERLTSEEVRALELEAVLDAVKNLSATANTGVMNSYICVGYSVVQYSLDGEPIGSLDDHQGYEAKAEIIATFLPRIVINSLGTALENAGLKIDSLTLEPIAAMHLVVPPTMRMLNIALVDVGAGTSDLALAAGGTIKSYGMVSYAGDAITAGIAEHFLLDSTVAEQVKIQLEPGQTIHCRDVFSNKLDLSYDDILSVIYPRIETLVEQIAEKILELNGGSPKGIIMVGGGSLTPDLAPLLAKYLDIPETLVRIRDRLSLEIVEGVPEFSGPEVITPIAIGSTHLDQRAMQLIHVYVNNHPVQFLKMASTTIGDALLHAGFNPAESLGRPGPAFTVEFNGRYVALPGTLGQPSTIFCNGEPADLTTPLTDGDSIELNTGQAGSSPKITVGEFTEAKAQCYSITLNGSPLQVEPEILINGHRQNLDYLLQDRDRISLKPINTFQTLFGHLKIPLEHELIFFHNGQKHTIKQGIQLRINGTKKPFTTPISPGQEAEYYREQITLEQIFTPSKLGREITIQVNNEKLTLTPETSVPLVNGKEETFDYVVKPNDRIEYDARSAEAHNSFIVTDVFRTYRPESAFLKKGGRILLNGREAGFTTPLKDGDTLEFMTYGTETENS